MKYIKQTKEGLIEIKTGRKIISPLDMEGKMGKNEKYENSNPLSFNLIIMEHHFKERYKNYYLFKSHTKIGTEWEKTLAKVREEMKQFDKNEVEEQRFFLKFKRKN